MLDLHRFSPFFPIGDGLVRLEVTELSPPLALRAKSRLGRHLG